MMHRPLCLAVLCATLTLGLGCPHDEPEDEGTEADQIGVAAQCQADADCHHDHEHETGGDHVELVCLTNFKGGYCGINDCSAHEDCPEGSACVAHDDGSNYCFRVCVDKSECNLNRDADNEANCSANITWVGNDQGKACVPPEGA